ncbi:Predicted ATPase [Tistlia consotensis]|uniref:Predicted ATPase n=1 Tax=Tistlia consotensis USBA 355 TaxID=560819 RepID=A0A1Y6BGQ5_9PROT|nr:AAA family ATPase [Tistlia consotensis]SMF10074.1 Predicted ATPase [Tistlia consotensis USBA 355]SNR34022.1 Predicted ATPase [Tistlia consotensis]
MILTFAVSGYRSLRELGLPLDRLNVVTGPNGSGKSSLYRALRLLADTAQGRVVAALAAEGGLPSTLWAGPERVSAAARRGEAPVQGTVRKERVALRLGFAGEDYGYAIDLGLPVQGGAFARDPEIKAEAVWAGESLRRDNVFATRNGPAVRLLDERAARSVVLQDLAPFDSMMTHAADPRQAPELLLLRERMRGWRFYDHFRTDAGGPARRAQVGTRTPVLASDGSDLAAALQTIREIGDDAALDEAIADAFPGSGVEIGVTDGLFEVGMRQHGLLRPLRAAELSDGTLRYLLLAAALLSPRPPSLLVLNEPETSLHPDLLAPLGRLIGAASRHAQLIVVTHARPLVEALSEQPDCRIHALRKELGETRVEAAEAPPAWAWPSR